MQAHPKLLLGDRLEGPTRQRGQGLHGFRAGQACLLEAGKTPYPLALIRTVPMLAMKPFLARFRVEQSIPVQSFVVDCGISGVWRLDTSERGDDNKDTAHAMHRNQTELCFAKAYRAFSFEEEKEKAGRRMRILFGLRGIGCGSSRAGADNLLCLQGLRGHADLLNLQSPG